MVKVVESSTALFLLKHENCGQTLYEHCYVAELVLSCKKPFSGYMNLTPFSNQIHGFVCCLGNKFQIKACPLKENRGYVFYSFVSKSDRVWHAHVPLA